MRKSNYFERHFLSESEQQMLVSKRVGEVRVGQALTFLTEQQDFSSFKFHILGIEEDFGPQLNAGKSGACRAFQAFLSRFFSVQVSDFFQVKDVCVHGSIRVQGNKPVSLHDPNLIEDLDEILQIWCQSVFEKGGIPIVIGGGHNNALPIIRALKHVLNRKLTLLNVDPHADLRDTSIRHSGNSFSFAFQEQLIEKYFLFGGHKNYNNQFILENLKKYDCEVWWFDDLLRAENVEQSFSTSLNALKIKLDQAQFGLEIDLDSISMMPSSAFTPSGFSVNEIRQLILKLNVANAHYLHLPEGAPTNDVEDLIVGKALAYFVSDFLRSFSDSTFKGLKINK